MLFLHTEEPSSVLKKTRAAFEPTPLGQTKRKTRELIQLQTESSFDEMPSASG
jgi:hypothetical protein